MKKTVAKLEMDDAFIPTEMKFKQGNIEVEFYSSEETLGIITKVDDKQVGHMRMPLYAAVAFGQMVTKTLNGSRFLK